MLTKRITNIENRKKNKTHSGFQDKTKEIKGSFRRAQVGKMLLGWQPNGAHSFCKNAHELQMSLLSVFPFIVLKH